MITSSNALNSEEFIFYIDIVSDFVKKKSIMKAINSFMKEKDKFNALSSYGIVVFQKDDNPINEYDIKDSESVLNIIDESWETRETTQSYLENGLYEILAYIFRKSRESRKNYRIIIITDAPSKLSEDYYNALYDLLIKAKKFSAFIDIIRVGNKKFYEDDVKLKVISSETHGGMFYCQDEKLLQNILGSLVQNKKEFNVLKTDEIEHVLAEDKVFYERLAVDLISLSPEDEEICTICEQELCPICEAHSDEIHKCFNCNTKFHNCCAAKYSIARNIGFQHVFRCPQCETLLKLDEEFVTMVYEEDLEEEFPEIETEREIQSLSEELEYKQEQFEEEAYVEEEEIEEREIEEKIYPENLNPPATSATTKKVKVGGFFGKEIEIKLKKELETQQPISEMGIPPSITNLKPPRKRGTGTIKLCKICGATLQGTNNCPMCGAKVD
ncbi:MAG: vWA domain-containing protein [Candidatus Thorarchaeota archaeon]